MTSWHRLEPNTADTDLHESVQAQVADPLWAMARQWQLGEFKGEDAASPVHMRAVSLASRIDTFRNDAVPGAPVEPFDSGQPLECRVEAESVVDGPAAVWLAAEAGQQFLRRLDMAGMGAYRRAVDWPTVAGFDLAGDGLERARLTDPDRARLALIDRRGLDGRRLYRMGLATLKDLAAVGLTLDEHALATVFDAWKLEYGDRFAQPRRSGDCWLDERFEYQFSLGAATGSGEVVLQADEYAGGHLDWYALRVAENETHGLTRRTPTRHQVELLPQPAMFQGQGASRWWEFEDRTVYFGNLPAGPADVARLVVAEFGVTFSDDWFIIPVRVDSGTLCRIATIEVIDTFGATTAINSTAVNDHNSYGERRPFRYFELEGDRSAAEGVSPWLLTLPALTDMQNSEPVERVWLVRDEQANVGWAIEQTIESPTGNATRRRQQWAPPKHAAAGDSDPAAGTVSPGRTRDEHGRPPDASTWAYRLQTPVPPWWVPLVPERTGNGADIRLRRARLQSWDELDQALAGAKGRLVGMARALRVYEEEVPRGGVQVSRHWQRARAADGRAVVWMARRKRPGRGDRGSGLEFDGIRR